MKQGNIAILRIPTPGQNPNRVGQLIKRQLAPETQLFLGSWHEIKTHVTDFQLRVKVSS